MQIDIVDMWKEHTPPPFSNMPDTYSLLVKHAVLWRLSYEITQPRWFHVPYLAFCGLFMRGGLHKAFELYKPDLVVRQSTVRS
jgi:1,2-diacylglycerol 3-beta-galactosyltransferase